MSASTTILPALLLLLLLLLLVCSTACAQSMTRLVTYEQVDFQGACLVNTFDVAANQYILQHYVQQNNKTEFAAAWRCTPTTPHCLFY